jgi:hypothetical protein
VEKGSENLAKKNTSEIINSTIPYRSPFWTTGVWWPWNVPSRTTSHHHWYTVSELVSSPSVKRNVVLR